MKRIIALLATATCLLIPVKAQTGADVKDTFTTAPKGGTRVETSVTLPATASAANICSSKDCWVDLITLSNKTADTVTVAVSSATDSKYLMKDVSLAANSTYVLSLPGGRKFPGGLVWSCSAGSSVDGYARGVRMQ